MPEAKKQPKERIMLQVRVNGDVVAKIDELAGRMKQSRQDFVEALIEEALHDNEWLIRVVTSRFFEPVRRILARKKESDGSAVKGRQAEKAD